ncbi:MAG: metallophosphatase family protein [Brevefilum sp.]|nr:metallophosphatase family protein [Brevefilum sp.]
MRTLIISDVHANLTALDAVLADAGEFSRVLCLGDLVGYGPDPNQCFERVRTLPGLQCVKGNHDAAILGEIETLAFNNEARASLAWLETELSLANRNWLSGLDELKVIGHITLAHGSPRNPVWEYILDVSTARKNMRQFETPICLVGHTHLPCIYQMEGEHLLSTRHQQMVQDEPFRLEYKSIVNPGSVGQPRDHDPRSAYMIYDDEDDSWTYHRVAYDVSQVQERILAAGLPKRHAYRLEEGW